MSHLVSMGGGGGGGGRGKKAAPWATAPSVSSAPPAAGAAPKRPAAVPPLGGRLPVPGAGAGASGAQGAGSSGGGARLAPLGSKSARGASSSALDSLFDDDSSGSGASGAKSARSAVARGAKAQRDAAKPKQESKSPAFRPLDFDDIENTSEEEINTRPLGRPAAGSPAAKRAPTDSGAPFARSMPPAHSGGEESGTTEPPQMDEAEAGEADGAVDALFKSDAADDSTASDLGLDVFGTAARGRAAVEATDTGGGLGRGFAPSGARSGRRASMPALSLQAQQQRREQQTLRPLNPAPAAAAGDGGRSRSGSAWDDEGGDAGQDASLAKGAAPGGGAGPSSARSGASSQRSVPASTNDDDEEDEPPLEILSPSAIERRGSVIDRVGSRPIASEALDAARPATRPAPKLPRASPGKPPVAPKSDAGKGKTAAAAADEWGDPLDILGLGGGDTSGAGDGDDGEMDDEAVAAALSAYQPSFSSRSGGGNERSQRTRRQLGNSTSSGSSTARALGSSGDESLSARFAGARDGTKSASVSAAATPRGMFARSAPVTPAVSIPGVDAVGSPGDQFTEELDDTALEETRAPVGSARGVPGIDLRGAGSDGGLRGLGGLGGGGAREGNEGAIRVASGQSGMVAGLAQGGGSGGGSGSSRPATGRTGGTSGRSLGSSARSLDSSLYSARTDATNDGGRIAIAAELAVVQEAHAQDVEIVRRQAAEREAQLRAEMDELKAGMRPPASVSVSAGAAGNSEAAQLSQALLKERRLREMAEEGRARAEGERARAEALASSESRALEAERDTSSSLRSDLEATRLALSKAEARASTFEAEMVRRGAEGTASADAAARHLEETQGHLSTIAMLRAELDAQRSAHVRELESLRAEQARLSGQLAARNEALSAAERRHEGDARHGDALGRVEALAARVEGLAASAQQLSSSVGDAWHSSMAARESHVMSMEGNVRQRLEEVRKAEAAAVRAHADLAALGEVLSAATREARAASADEKARLEREHARCEALVESLTTERAAATAALERERAALEAVRDRRHKDHEAFFTQLAESRAQLDKDRAAFDARRDASVKADAEAATRLAVTETKRRDAEEQLRRDQLEAERFEADAARAKAEYDAHREKVEREREELASEAARLARLGAAVQAKSSEAAAALEAVARDRRCADTAAAEAAADRAQASEDRAAAEKEAAGLAAQRKEADERRLAMAEERRRLQEERVAASRAAEQARQLQLDALQGVSAGPPAEQQAVWRHSAPRSRRRAGKSGGELLGALSGDLAACEAAMADSQQYLSQQTAFICQMQVAIGAKVAHAVGAAAPPAGAATAATDASMASALDRSSFTPLVLVDTLGDTSADMPRE